MSSSSKGKAPTNLRQQQLLFVTPEARSALQASSIEPQSFPQSSLFSSFPAQTSQRFYPTTTAAPAAQHGQYIITNSTHQPYSMSTPSLPASTPPQAMQSSLTNTGLGDDPFFRAFRTSVETTLKEHQEQTTASFSQISQIADRMNNSMENERVQTRAVLDALIGKVDQTQDLHLKIAKGTHDRVGRLEKLLGVPDNGGSENSDEQTATVWERLNAVENNLVEILERLKDPEASVDPLRVTHEVSVDPISEVVQQAAAASANRHVTMPVNGRNTIPVHYVHSRDAGPMVPNFYNYFKNLKIPTIYQPSLFPGTYGVPSPQQEPLTAAEWEDGADKVDLIDQDDGGRASTSSVAPTLEPSVPARSVALPGFASSRDSSLVRGVLSQDSIAEMFSLGPLSPLTATSSDDEEQPIPKPEAEFEDEGTARRPRRRLTMPLSSVSSLPASAVSKTNKKRKARSSDVGPRGSKKAKKIPGLVKERIKGKAGDAIGLAMAASQYCDWPKKVAGDVRQFAQCDKCDLWYHCICAGLTPDDPRMEEGGVFICPPCETFPDRKDIETSMKGRENVCSRPDCDYTNSQVNQNEYFIERIIGRKPDPKAPAKFCWLVLWDGYDISLSEWVDTDGIGGNPLHVKGFEYAARREGLTLETKGTVLLTEAKQAGFF